MLSEKVIKLAPQTDNIQEAVAILSNSTRKLLWFRITKMLIADKKIIYCVIYFRHTFVPYTEAAAAGQ